MNGLHEIDRARWGISAAWSCKRAYKAFIQVYGNEIQFTQDLLHALMISISSADGKRGYGKSKATMRLSCEECFEKR